MFKKVAFTITALMLSVSAQAMLVVDLMDNGSGGVIVSVNGSGTTSAGIGSVLTARNIGEYVQPGHGLAQVIYTLANPIAFSNNRVIDEIAINRDNGIDDFSLRFNGGVGSNVDFFPSASSLVQGLSFADLIAGTYDDSDSNDVRRVGGLTLNVVGASVDAPLTVSLLAGALALFGLRRYRR